MIDVKKHNGTNPDILLHQKEAELSELQSSFDEYIESSRQIEEELEGELNIVHKKLEDKSSENDILSKQVKNLTTQMDALQCTISNYKTELEEEKKTRRIAEIQQDEAETRARKSEGGYNVLKEEGDTLHETLALRELDIDELFIELNEAKERGRQEIEDLKADLIASSKNIQKDNGSK